jgi:pyridoxal phosphate enzyme (YggS family)
MKNIVSKNLETIRQETAPFKPAIIAVTKYGGIQDILSAYDAGLRNFGEARVMEAIEKINNLPSDIRENSRFHLIGHLQTNKAKKVWQFAEWIHSVDRDRLVQKLESFHDGGPRKKILLEVNTSGEQSKSGCAPDDCKRLCDLIAQTPALDLRGLMTIGPLNGDERAVRTAFSLLRELSQKHCAEIASPELSMGMSGDFEWAIEEGARMVRIGTVLVGERD